ncbi:hypothetical protein J7J83_02735 [bacterium]|nr:hypothetical protein [bacterium]
MKKIALFLAIPLLFVSLSGCTKNTQNSTEDSAKLLQTTSVKAIGALKNKNMGYLSTLAHPVKGIRFSPYATVDINNDIVLKADDLKNIRSNNKKFIWGTYDGKGDPIEEDFLTYFNEFVYDRDFANADKKTKNNSLSSGNSLNNLKKIYPDSQYYEYYFPGFNPEMGGMDWEALRLVFEQYKGKWYLIGIIHDQWTI